MDDTAQFSSDLNVARFVDKLREEHDPATRALLRRLLLEEWNKSGFNLKQLRKLRRQVIGSSARIAIQKAVVETLAANGQDVRLAEGFLCNLVEIQTIFEERYRDERLAADLCAMTMLREVGSLCAREVRISIYAYMKSLTWELPLLERTKEIFNCSNQMRLC
jgi:hypothetical protein